MVTLLDEDPEYRAYFQRVWTEVMNHVLTPAFLNERYDYYRAEGERLGLGRRDLEYLPLLKDFLDRRPAVAWKIATDWLRTGPAVTCRIGGTRGAVVVDGRRVAPGWQGLVLPWHASDGVGPPQSGVELFALGHQWQPDRGCLRGSRRDLPNGHRAHLGLRRHGAAGVLTLLGIIALFVDGAHTRVWDSDSF